MSPADYSSCTIEQILEKDSEKAFTLHFLGIDFGEYAGMNLEDVCAVRGIRLQTVLQELVAAPKKIHPEEQSLIALPVTYIIGCLRHAHGVFTRQKLPYIDTLIRKFHSEASAFQSVVKDLKVLFPLFTEDFVKHIHMEEDRLFGFIEMLVDAEKSRRLSSSLFYRLEKDSIHRFVVEHESHDDEMEGIRKITGDYNLEKNSPLGIRVLYSELQRMEQLLLEHARIENEILFPKAVALEGRVRRMMHENSRLN